MFGMGLLGWTVVIGILFVLPLWRINERAGLNPYYSLFALIPFAGLPLALGFLAFKPWPNGEHRIRGPFDEFDRAKEHF
ncbi:MAG: hypothetical protein ACMVY4_14975 [Minwuia sp.]|uniref:hypothetical protein n=1 Tax=Minwuia sp. TaxID=2493630 RepID=UPI003A8A4AC3